MSGKSLVLAGARAVTPAGVLDPGWVQVGGGRITGAGQGRPPAGTRLDLDGGWLLPGFIDLHMHGGGGFDAAASPEAMAGAVAFHRAHGTTRTLVSLAAAPVDQLCAQLGWVAELTAQGPGEAGHVLGAHLEGPFLAPARCGAQDPAHLLTPDPAVFATLLAAARGCLRQVTVAPELPGAGELISAVVRAGAVAAIGHTDASFGQAMAGVAAGARAATHLFNAMPPLAHRAPGAAGAALAAGLACEVINDGVHTHPSAAALTAERDGRLVLVTDAMQAAGMPDGCYRLGGREVTVRAGMARLRGTDTLAGSTLTMDAAVRRTVRESGLSIGQAAAASAANPARVLGLDDCGAIAPGLAADLVVLDGTLHPVAVMAAGRWCGPVPC